MDYTELHDLLKINDADVYVIYRVFLCEDKQSDYTNHESLLKPAPLKGVSGVNIRELNGRKYSSDLKPCNDEREFTLYFACHGDSRDDLYKNYNGFINFIKKGLNNTGWLTIKVIDIPDRTFKCFVSKFADLDILTLMSGGIVASKFKVTFIEPDPVL